MTPEDRRTLNPFFNPHSLRVLGTELGLISAFIAYIVVGPLLDAIAFVSCDRAASIAAAITYFVVAVALGLGAYAFWSRAYRIKRSGSYETVLHADAASTTGE